MNFNLSKATTKTPLVYVFRHIIENQAIVTRVPYIQEQNTYQIGTIKPKLRKDHWKPVLVISGFTQDKTADMVFHSLATYPKELRNEEWKTLPKRLRVVDLKNQIAHKLSATCRVLEDLPNYTNDPHVFPEPIAKESLKLTCYWETDYWKKMIEKENLQWPEFVSHDKLELIRGRSIANEEFKTVQSGFERLNQVNQTLKGRKEQNA